ncbi:MAG TPA: ABC transporter permease [Vicinamibacterales bacterium]|jgi:putative ABC transport system permease protein
MTTSDLLAFAGSAVVAHRLRSALTMLGIVIGIASVILLTSLGAGTREYIATEFAQFGTNLLQINPGRTTTGGMPTPIGSTVRKITVDDAEAIRRLPGVECVVPLAFGQARVEAGQRGRSVFIYGVTSDVPAVWKFGVGQGRFLPAGDPRRGAPVTVLGPKLKQELFGDSNPLGAHVRIGGRRFQVIGVMAAKGQLLGFDIDDAAYVPVSTAQELFNQDGLIEIDVLFSHGRGSEAAVESIRNLLKARHDNEEDFTIVTQAQMLEAVDRILGIVSWAVSGIGAISLVVGAIGVLTIMWIAVGERTAEIGLLKAIGATPSDILLIFLTEATMLSFAGGALGVTVGLALATLIQLGFPGVPVVVSMPYVAAAIVTSVLVGLVCGVVPARRATRLDPVDALHAE